MDWRLHGLLYGLLIAIGVAGGFYFATALQKQIEALIGAAVVIGFLTWLGSGADLLGLLKDWYREKREAERTPTINHTGIFRDNNHETVHDENYNESIYYLRIELVSGEGMVNKCHASVTVLQTSLSFLRTHWRKSRDDFISISRARPEYLELFTMREYHNATKSKQLIFYNASSLTDNFKQPYETAEKVLTVVLDSENGNTPKPYSKTIQDIMDESCPIHAQSSPAK